MVGASLSLMGALRRAGIVLAVAVLAIGLSAAVAGAKKKHKKKVRKWDSGVTLTHPSNNVFSGVVSSKLDACRKNREVVLYYTDPITFQTQPLSVQHTDGNGRYEVDLASAAYPGTYQAQLIKQRIKAMHAPQDCRGAQSASFTV